MRCTPRSAARAAQILELEEELGIEIFVRSGKRLLGLTPPGQTVLPIVERLLLAAENLKRAGDSFSQVDAGSPTIVTPHGQARYRLPTAVQAFRALILHGVVHLLQGSPASVAQRLLQREADIGIATDVLPACEDLTVLPCCRWYCHVLVPRGHGLDDGQPLTLERVPAYPLVSYDGCYAGRAHIDESFAGAGLTPDSTILAMNADVIKTFVELGVGVGIVAEMAYEPERDLGLVALDASALFAQNTTRIAVRRGSCLREHACAFMALRGSAPFTTTPTSSTRAKASARGRTRTRSVGPAASQRGNHAATTSM